MSRTSTPRHTPAGKPTARYTPLLGPATTGHTTPSKVVLAALTVAATKRIPPRAVADWLLTRRPDTAHIVMDPRAYHRLTVVARDRVAGAKASGGRREMLTQLTRRLVTHLLTPTAELVDSDGAPLATPRAINTARGALAIVGVPLITQVADTADARGPMDSALVHQTRVAVRLGISRLAARSALQTCVRLGWLTEVKRMPGSGTRYRLGRVRTGTQKARMASLMDHVDAVVEALMDGDDTEVPGMDVQALLSAVHPTWSYPPDREPGQRLPDHVDRTSWLVAYAEAVSGETGYLVDPAHDLGVSRRLVARHREILVRAGLLDGLVAHDAEPIASRLWAIGEENGAVQRAREAEAARREAAQERVDEVAAARARSKRARGILRSALLRVEKHTGRAGLPGPSDPREARATWAMHLAQEVRDVEPGLRPSLRSEIVRRLTRAGHGGDAARSIAARIAPDPEPTSRAV